MIASRVRSGGLWAVSITTEDIEMKYEESGNRIKVRAVINCAEDHEVIQWLARRLSLKWGGCTVLPQGKGYWVDSDGTLLSEPATIVEVSFLDGADVERDIMHARHLMTNAQFSVGGEWCHIEVSEFEAAHSHAERFFCAKVC